MNKLKLSIIITCIIIAVLVLFLIYNKSILPVDKFINAFQPVADKSILKHTIAGSRPVSREGFETWQVHICADDVRDIAFFEGNYYLATSGGLKILGTNLRHDKTLINLDGLAENDITSLAVFNSMLYIGLKTKGLMTLCRNNLTHYIFDNPEANNITALVSAKDCLYIGTNGAGALQFDGNDFILLQKGAKKSRSITSLCLFRDNLIAGTMDNGIFIISKKNSMNIAKPQGLLSNTINCLVPAGSALYIGTPLGMNVANESFKILTHKKGIFATSFATHLNTTFIGTFNKGIFSARYGLSAPIKINSLKTVKNSLFALSSKGVFLFNQTSWQPVGRERETGLPFNHITSLSIDSRGRLVIGSFDNGIAVLSRNGKFEHSIKVPNEVNYMFSDKEKDELFIASTKGVAVLDASFKEIKTITKNDGLIGENVSHIKQDRGKIFYATNEGLTIEDRGLFKSLYHLHGLINNHAYCVETLDGKVYLGTLGGITVLKDNVAQESYTTVNSSLSASWINAIIAVGKDLYIGTYGGGVDRLSSNGKWENLKKHIGSFEVNPNAMYYSRPFLFVGTLDRGAFIYNTEKNKWRNLTSGLSSMNVTAVTSDSKNIYFGTENGLTVIPLQELKNYP